MTQIVPGILEERWEAVEQGLLRFDGVSPWAHLDISDGIFTPTTTWRNPEDLPLKRENGQRIELHLMVARPWEVISPWLHTMSERFIVHLEAFEGEAGHLEQADRVIADVQAARKEILFGLKLATPIAALERHIGLVDGVLLMAHEVGVSGVPFDSAVLEKIAELRKHHPSLTIEVDGGINEATVVSVKTAGANRVVATSYLNDFDDPGRGIARLRRALGEPVRDVTKNGL